MKNLCSEIRLPKSTTWYSYIGPGGKLHTEILDYNEFKLICLLTQFGLESTKYYYYSP